MKTKDVVQCGITTALLCVLCPISIPVSGIPITLATFVIYLIASLCKLRVSLTSTILYLLIGCMGLPVFSGFSGGITHILGPSGGFILGYIPLVITLSYLNESVIKYTIGTIIGTVALYFCGCIGYLLNTGCSVATVLTVCILPFLPGDIVKIILSLVIAPKLKRIIYKN